MAPHQTTQDAIESARKALRDAPPKRKLKTVADAIKELRHDLLKARASGYTTAELKDFLAQAGVHASAPAIERVLRVSRGKRPLKEAAATTAATA